MSTDKPFLPDKQDSLAERILRLCVYAQMHGITDGLRAGVDELARIETARSAARQRTEAEEISEKWRTGLIYRLRSLCKATPYQAAPNLVDAAIEAANYLEEHPGTTPSHDSERMTAGRQRQADADFLYGQAKLYADRGDAIGHEIAEFLADLVGKNTLVRSAREETGK